MYSVSWITPRAQLAGIFYSARKRYTRSMQYFPTRFHLASSRFNFVPNTHTRASLSDWKSRKTRPVSAQARLFFHFRDEICVTEQSSNSAPENFHANYISIVSYTVEFRRCNILVRLKIKRRESVDEKFMVFCQVFCVRLLAVRFLCAEKN